ncbi:MAG: glycerophosphodiester phosphodiesterase [Fusobacteriaceae bacterium]
MIVFAHRGASGYAPQNSLAAAKKSVQMDAEAIEFDVQLSKDGFVVVIHDFHLDYLTENGKGCVKDFTLQELKTMKLKNKFQEEYSDEKIPTLQEFLNTLPNNMFINIEIKAMDSDMRDIEGRVIDVLKDFPEKKNIIISSFDHELLNRFYLKSSKYEIGMLTDIEIKCMGDYFNKMPLKIKSINISLELAQEKLVNELKSYGFDIFVYTVNSKKSAWALKEMGVDGIFSDYPDILSENFKQEEI